MSMRVVIVDDEVIKRVSLVDDLRDADFDVADFSRGEPAIEHLKKCHADVVVTDLKMPGMSGLEVLRHIRTTNPDIDVIVMTAFGTIESAVEAMRQGAYDYVSKPFSTDELVVVLNRLEEQRRLQRDNRALRIVSRESVEPYQDLVAESPAMIDLMQQIGQVAQSDTHVLLTGETGVGKDVVARAIHELSLRAGRPFIKITCATYSRQLLESELFGHQRGAYTGADKAQPGRFELAHGGTVYLDDVDDIPVESQTRLLRVIEERVIERVGGTRIIPVDVRVIASTKVDLGCLAKSSKFRPDLYYRLNVVSFHIPPLRDRPEDIVPLIEHFCRRDRHACACSPGEEALSVLETYCWPGNVRELRNIVERWKLLKRCDAIQLADLPSEIRNIADRVGEADEASSGSFRESIDAFERRLLTDALKQVGGSKTRAAEILKLKPSTLRNKLARHALNGYEAPEQ